MQYIKNYINQFPYVWQVTSVKRGRHNQQFTTPAIALLGLVKYSLAPSLSIGMSRLWRCDT